MTWRQTSFQFVAFGAPVAGLQPNDLFHTLTGSFPRNFGTTVLPTGVTSTAEGLVEGLLVAMSNQPGRLDLVINAEASVGEAHPFAPLPESVDVGQLAIEWLLRDESPITQANRLSVICVAHRGVSTIPEGMLDLAERTGLNLDVTGTSDFILQVNRKRPMEVFPGEMNRILQFSFVALRSLKIPFGTSYLGASGSDLFFEQVQADINTGLQPGVILDTLGIRQVWPQLAEEAQRLTEAGRLAALWA